VYHVSGHCSISVVVDGFCMLGASFGLYSFKIAAFQKIGDKIAHDLQLISQVPVRHIRAKLLVYCVNARFDYFMGTADLTSILPQAEAIDRMVDNSVGQLLGWDAAQQFGTALDQLRLPIRKGGWGLHSKVHSAPAAVLGAFFRFRQWAVEHPELLQDPIYGKALGSDPTSFQYRYYHSYAKEKDLFPTLISPPDSISTPSGHVPQVLGVPCPSVLASWPVECLPLHRRLYAHTVDTRFRSLCATLQLSADHHVPRIESLAKQSCPANSKGCPFKPMINGSSDNDIVSLFHPPMSLMSLRANQDFYELSNMTFSVITSLQCGIPMPPHVLRAAATWPQGFDSFGHQALNSSAENLRISTHDEVVRKMRSVLAQQGLTVTCKGRDIPRSGALPHPQQRVTFIFPPQACASVKLLALCLIDLVSYWMFRLYTAPHIQLFVVFLSIKTRYQLLRIERSGPTRIITVAAVWLLDH